MSPMSFFIFFQSAMHTMSHEQIFHISLHPLPLLPFLGIKIIEEGFDRSLNI